MTLMEGPTEIAGARTFEVGGYRFIFYPDVRNPVRSGGQPALFHWGCDRLYLDRSPAGYDFSFTRYLRDVPEDPGVSGVVRFGLTGRVPEDIVGEATRQFLESCSRTHPYWGWSSYRREDFLPLTYQSTHTTLSNIAAVSDRTARSLSGADPWYCEQQGADTGPIPATDTRTYTTLLGSYYTQLFQRAVVDNAESLTVNRTVHIEFAAPVSSVTMEGSWEVIRAELLAVARARGREGCRDITLDGVRQAVARLRADGRLVVDCRLDETVPDDEAYREYLLHHSGCADGLFLDLARGAVLDAPESVPSALAADADGPPNPWGNSWRVTADTSLRTHRLADVLEGGACYSRPIGISTQFTAEFAEIRRDPGRYFFTRYPDDDRHDLTRVFRPVMPVDNPALSSVYVVCGYPDTSGKYVYEFQIFDKPRATGETVEPWYYGTAMKSLSEVSDPPPEWTPDRTRVRRSVCFYRGQDVSTNLFCFESDDMTCHIDPQPHGALFNDMVMDISPAMLKHLDVYPIRLHPGLRSGEAVGVRFEALDASGVPYDRYGTAFTWEGPDDVAPRRWMVYSTDPAFPARFRYRAILTDDSGVQHTGPWIHSSGSWSVRVPLPRGASRGRTG